MMTRRKALKTTALIAATAATLPRVLAQAQPGAAEPFTLPPLPYDYDALEPHIDVRTMEIHHDKHHAAYVANLNKALAGQPELAKKSIAELVVNVDAVPEAIRTTVRNNAGGHYNHSLFWLMMAPGGGAPSGELAKALEATFGSVDGFKAKFSEAAMKVFGSGWAWLTLDGADLRIETTPNQDSAIMLVAQAATAEVQRKAGAAAKDKLVLRQIPLLGLDVWEHAYYLNYQNRRADYIAAWWNVVNWEFVSDRFAQARKNWANRP
ncbi:MAG TPA: superoxide dismutase [Verrucomicrobiae bacterium]